MMTTTVLLRSLLFASFNLACLGWTSCPQSVPTVSVVSRCPSTEKEWISAAERKNCSALRKSQNCSEDGNFVYHCVLNQEATELMEVCAPIWYMAGYCARFSIADKRLINDPRMDCTDFVSPCPRRFPSNESYKYQMCYHKIYEANTSINDRPRMDVKTIALVCLLAIFGTTTVVLIILLFLGYKKYVVRVIPPCKRTDENEDGTHATPLLLTQFIVKETRDPDDQDNKSKRKISETKTDLKSTAGKSGDPSMDIGNLRQIMSKAFNISCIWIVDAELGIFFDDETMIESLTKQYTFLFGYERRPLEREDENSDTEIDIISKKEITTGKCKMPCGHYSAPDTLFNWIKQFLSGYTEDDIRCPDQACAQKWDINQIIRQCIMSPDEEKFFKENLEKAKMRMFFALNTEY
ncbi:uncharacterized protein LOC111126852 isoform X2 [Crassostrea virginica]